MERKDIIAPLELKDDGDGEPKGEVEAVIATFNKIDRDGDVILPNAFTEGQRVMLLASHDWSINGWVGDGTITKMARTARFKGRFWLDTPDGASAFEKVKRAAAAGLGQWSWGFGVPEGSSRNGEFHGQEVRFLGEEPLEVFEASPVLVGAGVGTRTVDIKDDRPHDDDAGDDTTDNAGVEGKEGAIEGEDAMTVRRRQLVMAAHEMLVRTRT